MAHDVAVVGAGIIGCAVARALDDAGLAVTLIDPNRPCSEASHAAGGLLTPQYDTQDTGPFLDLSLRAREIYPRYVDSLRAEVGVDPELRSEGTLVVALSDEDEEALEEALRWQRERDLPVERREARELRDEEPVLAPDVRWGLYLPNDIQVDNQKLCAALIESLRRRSVRRRFGLSVIAIEERAERVAAVRLDSGELIDCDTAVLAAGAWSGRLEGLPRAIPVKPIRGQMVSLEGGGSAPSHNLASPRSYLVPRLDGRVIAGSTLEDVGYDRSVTPKGLREILSNLLDLAPGLSDVPIADTWSGLRPATPDGLPIIGADPALEGLYYATGHYRNGLLLGPLTGDIVAELVRGESASVDLGPFSCERFGTASD